LSFWGCSNNPAAPQAVSGTFTDTDGNVYHAVSIGTQVWMVENLKTTRFNDGSAIPLVTGDSAWAADSATLTPRYCWYNDSAVYGNTYGALYNWYAVNTGKLAPTGWHVPTDSEWGVLAAYLGGKSLAARPLKEAGTAHWVYPNTGAANTTGFSALPGGYRNYDGSFSWIGYYGNWWSSTAYLATTAYFCGMYYDDAGVYFDYDFDVCGFSVRCIKNP
jgi:uncharacterized protein (TIGR02145 family)